MSCRDVEDFVYQAVADGASSVHTIIEGCMCNESTVEKVYAFIRAAKEAKRLIDAGSNRQEVGQCVSDAGQQNFWGRWSGYAGSRKRV